MSSATGDAPKLLPGRKLLPVWLLGLANMPLGLTGGLTLLTIPQLLAARHVPEPVIAQLTTLALVPTFIVFLIGPVLDMRFRRRTYAIAATLLAAVSSAVALMNIDNHGVLGAAMFCALAGAAINGVAQGGWFGSILAKEQDATLGAWITVANAGSFGLIAMAAIRLMRVTPTPLAAVLLSAPVLAPLLIYAATPDPGPGQKAGGQSFSRFFRDLVALVRQPVVLELLLLFAVPAAAFALTNTLGGLGRDYHASESFVATIGGAAATVAGVFGSLIVPPLARRTPPRILYLAIGVIGSLFTLSLILLPHTPLLFATAMIGQNVAQSAAFAAVAVIALQSLGHDNPFAATQFGLLICASALPVTYMQLLDGHAYGAGGLRLMYVADGGLGLLACAAMAILLVLWARRGAAAQRRFQDA